MTICVGPPIINPLSANLARSARMVYQQTMDKLYALKLQGLAQAYEEQRQQPQSADLSFDERLALLIERQWRWKENRALATRLA